MNEPASATLSGEGFKYKGSFYKFTCGLVFENAKPHLEKATVVFDGTGSRQFKQELERYLKRKMNEEDAFRIHKVKVQDSGGNKLIQLADMICGAVAQSFKSPDAPHRRFRGMVAHRELFCQFWPRDSNGWKKQEYETRKAPPKGKRRKKRK